MIEEYLMNYGVLGLWTLSLIYEKFTFQKQMKKIIERNTEALLKVNSNIEYLKKK